MGAKVIIFVGLFVIKALFFQEKVSEISNFYKKIYGL